MFCPECKKCDTKVIDSRDDMKIVRRRRECLCCNYRFTTYERIDIPKIKIEKRDGRLEDYSKEKILAGIEKAFKNRPIEKDQISSLVDDIEQEIVMMSHKVVPSTIIGEVISKKIKVIDQVAYLRFISVYKSFSSAKNFQNEAEKLIRRKK